MNVLIFIGNYLWNILISVAAILWSIAIKLIRRIFLLGYHIISGPYFLFLSLKEWTKTSDSDAENGHSSLGKYPLYLLAWIGRVISKALDILLLGELLDLVFQIVKPNQRVLTASELVEAQKVFGMGLPYWQIRIDEFSLLAWMGAWFTGSSDMGVTTFHTINFTRRLDPKPGNRDMEWLIHELAHVNQMERAGIQYIVEALVAQNTGGYHYGGPSELAGKKLKDFNREQQAEIAADYYDDVLYGTISADNFMPLIEEFRDRWRLWD